MLYQNYRNFADYNQWMNQKIYASAHSLPEEELLADKGAFFGSIQETLGHILWADKAWIRRMAIRGFGKDAIDPAIYEGIETHKSHKSLEIWKDFSKLKAERETLDQAIIQWMDKGLSEESLSQKLEYQNSSGATFRAPLHEILSHFFNHQTHHRGQVTTLLYQMGVDPGVTDFAVYLRDRKKRKMAF